MSTIAGAASSPGIRYELNRFLARVRADGSLHWGSDGGFSGPRLELGCQVWLRGFVSDRTDLMRALAISADAAPDAAQLFAHAFRRWGDSVQRHLLGEYAAAVYDAKERTLFLTHDALGLEQIFYRADGDGLLFGSHLLDVVEKAGLRELDSEYIATYLARGYLTTERTPFVGVKRLLPGMSLRWSPQDWSVLRTWKMSEVPGVRLAGDGAYEEQFRTLIDAALRATINVDGKTWVSLSGGLDSSTVLAVAARTGAANLGAYSFIAPSSPQGDEQPWARAVVEQYGVPWQTIDAAIALPFAELPETFAFQGEPTSAVLHIATNRLIDAMFAEHGVRTLMTGHGGDALLGASAGTLPSVLVDHVFNGHPLRSVRAAGQWSREYTGKRSLSFLLWHAVIRASIAHLRGDHYEPDSPLPVPAWMNTNYARRRGILAMSRKQVAPREQTPGRQEIAESSWGLALSGGSARDHGVYDVRRPLLYRPLFEFLLGIPGEQRFQPRCDRWLQRRAMKGILPESVRRRRGKKYGTWAFVEGLARAPQFIDYLCDDPQLASLGITTKDAWREAMKQASIGNTSGDRFFIAAITLEVWLKQFAAWRPNPLQMTWAEMD